LSPGPLDEDPPHGLGGGGEEVAAAVEVLVTHQPQIGLMDQRGGVEGMAGGFRGQARGGELPQLVVDERQEVGSSLAVAGSGSVKEAGHRGHAATKFISNWRQNHWKPRVIGHTCRWADTNSSTPSHSWPREVKMRCATSPSSSPCPPRAR